MVAHLRRGRHPGAVVLEGGGVGRWPALGHALSERARGLGPAAAPEPDHAAGRAAAHPSHCGGPDGELSRAVCGAGCLTQ